MLLAAAAASATVLTLMPLLVPDTLARRMKAVALEREQIRQRERQRLARTEKVTLRRTPKQYVQNVVDYFQLAKWVGQDEARALLVQAGYRGQAPYFYCVTYFCANFAGNCAHMRDIAAAEPGRLRKPLCGGGSRQTAMHSVP